MFCAAKFHDAPQPRHLDTFDQSQISLDASGGVSEGDAMRGCESMSVAGEMLQCSVTLKISESQQSNIVPTVLASNNT